MRCAWFSAVTAIAGALVACNGVLGWDAARVDPILTSDASTSDASTPDAGDLNCESYCTEVMARCTGEQLQYLTTAVCLSMCSHFDLGGPTDDKVDSLGCRQHFLLAAGDPAVNCVKAGPLGGNTCGDHCKAFC